MKSKRYLSSLLFRSTAIVAGVLLLFPFRQAGQNPPALQDGSGVVTGRVLSIDGSPATGIRVGALVTTSAATNGALMSLTQTDADGRYRLNNIPPGDYYIVAGPLDAPLYLPGVASQSGATVVTISAGAMLADRDFHLTAPFAVRVSGRVIREGGQHTGSQVILTRTSANFNTNTFNANIAADGTFDFPAVRPGIYQARVTPGVSLAPITVTVQDKDIRDLEIAIPISALDVMITVSVTLDGEGPLPRFQLQLMPDGPVPVNSPQILPNFSTTGRSISVSGARTPVTLPAQLLPQMDYRIRVFPSGNNALPDGYVVKSIMAGSVDLFTQPLQITAVNPAEIAIHLAVDAKQPPWVRLRGRVTGADTGHTMPASIVLQGLTLTSATSAAVQSDGTFEFPMVLPGTYQARLTPNADTFARPIVVRRDDTAIVEIPLKIPSFKVTGRTADVAPPNKFFRAMLWSEPPGSTGNPPANSSVAADGSFVFPTVQPGTYRAAIAVCESDVCTSMNGTVITVDKDIENLSLTSQAPPLPLSARSITPTATATLVATNPIGGTVVMENGAPMPHFRLKVTTNSVTRSVGVDDKSFTMTLPNGDHRVAVADLPAGYEVRSINDGTSDLRIWPLSIQPRAVDSAVLAGSVVPERIKIVLGVTSPAPWVKVGGRVVGASAGQVKTVELTGKILSDVLKASIGPDGTFAFSTVIPDTYKLRLLPGGNSTGQTITVGETGLDGVEIDSSLHR